VPVTIEVEEGWLLCYRKKLIETKRNYSISNASISGDTSAGGLARIDQILTAQKPGIVLLQLGANDGCASVAVTDEKQSCRDVRHAQKAGAKVILLGMKIPPNYGKRYVDMFYNVIRN